MKTLIRSFKRILIANRGEIAVRIMKTAKMMGIETVAIYTKSEKNSLHVKKADYKALLIGDNLNETYLNSSQIIDIAKRYQVNAIHPGYGFLSENAEFASLCKENSIVFIGPSPENIKLMGSKKMANKIAVECDVPILKKLDGNTENIINNIDSLHFPVIIKASAGGGGKGMRIIHSKEELLPALEKAGFEAERYFKDNTVYAEEYIPESRHIEVQILADTHGKILHLFDRECSIQRRYQKVIEEAPAMNIKPVIRSKMMSDAIKLAKHISYSSAGTIEYLVTPDDRYYFLEMNTRIQVEHPVTEEITGIDIVEKQINIASGMALDLDQQDIKSNGHAIEARIYAEDPYRNFLPTSGKIKSMHLPLSPHIRIDRGSSESESLNPNFDPLLKKVISWDTNREESNKRLIEFMRNYAVFGVTTNQEFLLRTLMHSDFMTCNYSTNFFRKNEASIFTQVKESEIERVIYGISYLLLKENHITNNNNIWNSTGHWRHMNHYKIMINQDPLSLEKISESSEEKIVKIDNIDTYFTISSIQYTKQTLTFLMDGKHYNVSYFFDEKGFYIQLNGNKRVITDYQPTDKKKQELKENTSKELKAPIPGRILDIMVNNGDTIQKGAPLIILEAMKIENHLKAWKTTKIKNITVKKGQQVGLDDILLETE